MKKKGMPVKKIKEKRKKEKKAEKKSKRIKQKQEIVKKTNPDIKQFIDFFSEACVKIRNEKPRIIHGKDGWLVKYALKKISVSQLEQLSLWFLSKKKGLSPTIGAMLSTTVLDALQSDMDKPNFWKEINEIYDIYYKNPGISDELIKKFSIPFTPGQITEIKEQVARMERMFKLRR